MLRKFWDFAHKLQETLSSITRKTHHLLFLLLAMPPASAWRHQLTSNENTAYHLTVLFQKPLIHYRNKLKNHFTHKSEDSLISTMQRKLNLFPFLTLSLFIRYYIIFILYFTLFKSFNNQTKFLEFEDFYKKN